MLEAQINTRPAFPRVGDFVQVASPACSDDRYKFAKVLGVSPPITKTPGDYLTHIEFLRDGRKTAYHASRLKVVPESEVPSEPFLAIGHGTITTSGGSLNVDALIAALVLLRDKD